MKSNIALIDAAIESQQLRNRISVDTRWWAVPTLHLQTCNSPWVGVIHELPLPKKNCKFVDLYIIKSSVLTKRWLMTNQTEILFSRPWIILKCTDHRTSYSPSSRLLDTAHYHAHVTGFHDYCYASRL
jgi:hypothetical protein